ncbi:flagellar hook-basal body complex protein [Sphingomonas aerolata]|jgi:flagellar basal-body rod protein FlgF|uniref:flagellar hook-basal body complex protein n=1 Tax=Sphingomonas aerolata TaxID=185951 RepID=UPI002FDF71A3
MDISSYVLLSHEQALKRRLDVAANNIANMNTTGFRRERPVFREYVARDETPAARTIAQARTTSYVLDYGAMHDTVAGGFQSTGNPLDLMIDGPGYLAVEAPGGGTAYTRAGFIKINQDGELTTAGGLRLRGEGGAPIAVPIEQLDTLSIGPDGTVTAKDGPLGRIAVTVFDDERGVSPRGDGLMAATGGRELAAAETRFKTGGVEGSNVEAIVETTSMVDILRAYQSSMKMSQDIEDMRRRAIDRLGRIS